jgi:non-ribosomal peptide synthetase component F
MTAVRHETHCGDRVVRCFAERPANIDIMFREAVARAPDRAALALGDTRITYRALDETVDAVAADYTKATGSLCCSGIASSSSTRSWARHVPASSWCR